MPQTCVLQIMCWWLEEPETLKNTLATPGHGLGLALADVLQEGSEIHQRDRGSTLLPPPPHSVLSERTNSDLLSELTLGLAVL